MTTIAYRVIAFFLAIALATLAGCGRAANHAGIAPREARWIATWAPSQQLTEPHNMPPAPGLRGSTLRQVARVTLGGTRIRLCISNVFGDAPLELSSVHIARPRGRGGIAVETDRSVTFSGDTTVKIPSGQFAISDSLDYELEPLSDVVITMHVERISDRVTGHPGSRATSYLAAGQHLTAAQLPNVKTTEHWYLLSGVDVLRNDDARVVVALGNSITDGRGSGTDRDTRWTDYLARRLHENETTNGAVVNAGLGGNAVIRGGLGPPALERLDRDVLDQPGVRWLIVLEGVNDIGSSEGMAASAVADELINAYQQIARRARERGLLVYIATIPPFGGSQYDSPAHRLARQRVNDWIRTNDVYDAVIDLDAAMRDPADPSRLHPAMDTGDHLHPNEYGYRVIAEAIDLGLFAR